MAARESVRAHEAAPADTTVRDATPMRGSTPHGESLSVADPRQRQQTSSLRRFVTGSPLGTISALFLLFAIGVALFGPYLGTGNPEAVHPTASFAAPTGEYPMGGDYLGRSVLSRLVSGLRISLALAASSALLAVTDVLFAFPVILLGLLAAMVLQPGVPGVVMTIVIATIPVFCRVARGPTLSVRATEYTVSARVIGASPARILLRYILPNVSTPLLVQLAFTLSGALIAEGALSFLGLGVQPPTPSLGSLLRDGKTYMEIAPWTMFFPALTLAAAILAVNLLGDELQAFTDPRLRGR
jgi:peptide/nickel transport system permease protein